MTRHERGSLVAHSPVTQLVALGASAGGIEALSALVASLPSPFPAPIVVAQHLDPARPSQLQAILARVSPLPVRLVADKDTLAPGVIYVTPSNQHIRITDHQLSIDPDGPSRPMPSIDLLFETAAAVFGEGLIAVVLTGLGTDGAAGARRVKEAGGTVVIQNPLSAPFPSMPQAIVPTAIDVIADADAMGPLLYDLLTGAYTPSGARDDRQIAAILEEVRQSSGIDFSQYKLPTIRRRLQRRLVATGMHTLHDYRHYLRQHAEEYDRLVNAFLIKVTEFFRDQDLFAILQNEVLPELLAAGRQRGKELRLWSAGCATGEEAYSLALLVADALGVELGEWTVRIFATDLDGAAVDFARRGVYPESALQHVPAALVASYFQASDGAYTVTKEVRSLLVFGEHDLGRRPPFPRIDLTLCRNVLIYFTPELQLRALEQFAFAVRPGGYLVLGKAESASLVAQHFTPVQSDVRLYRREGTQSPTLPPGSSTNRALARRERPAQPMLASQDLARVRREAQLALSAQLAAEELLLHLPIGVVIVDRRYDIQRINSMARRLLGIHGIALGEDLIHLAQGVPRDELRAAIDAAFGGEERALSAVPTNAVMPGERRYLHFSCGPHRPQREAQQVDAALVVITDRTEEEVARLTEVSAQISATYGQLLAANEELTTNNDSTGPGRRCTPARSSSRRLARQILPSCLRTRRVTLYRRRRGRSGGCCGVRRFGWTSPAAVQTAGAACMRRAGRRSRRAPRRTRCW